MMDELGSQTEKNPLISIVTGLYNSSRYLPRFFAMLEAQTYPHWEMLFVDDGSKDQTKEMVRAKIEGGESRIRLLSKKPEGSPSRSRAVGLTEAKGEYIAFCDHDDFWHPEKLALQLALITKIEGIAILHTNRVVWTQEAAPTTMPDFSSFKSQFPYHKQNAQDVLYTGQKILFSSFMAKTDLVRSIGFHPDLKGVDDFYLFLRLAQLGSIYRIDLPLTYYYAHAANLSHSPRIFVDGCYQVAKILEQDEVPSVVKRSVWAQAYRSDAVVHFASDRVLAMKLLWKSLTSYFIWSTLTRLGFLLLTFFVPTSMQEALMRYIKKLKFKFPLLQDLKKQRNGKKEAEL